MRNAAEILGRQVYEDVMIADAPVVVPLDEVSHTEDVARADAYAALFKDFAFHAVAHALTQAEPPARDTPASATWLFAALDHQYAAIPDDDPGHADEGDRRIFSFHDCGELLWCLESQYTWPLCSCQMSAETLFKFDRSAGLWYHL
jgi:hypothetical protein